MFLPLPLQLGLATCLAVANRIKGDRSTGLKSACEGLVLSLEKEGHPDTGYNMGESGGHYAQ